MRAVVTFIVGGIVTAVGIILGIAAGGLLSAGAWITAMFAATVTVGLTTAAIVESWVDRPVVNPNLPEPSRHRIGRARCTCGTRMQRTGSLLLCPSCDRAPLLSQ